MVRKTYPVFVDVETATKLGISEVDGRPEDAEGRNAVYVGETPEVTTYDSWDEVPESARGQILRDSNRQRIQDAKNATRADVKDGGSMSLTKQREALIASLADPTNATRLAEIAVEIGRLAREIEDAKVARKAKK